MPNISKPADMSSIWASAGNSVAPSAAKIAQGWVVELPPYQTANFIANRQDSFNAHVNQHGIPVWDNATEYQGGVSYSKGSNGVIYKCLATNTGLDPTNPNNSSSWVRAFEDFGSVAVVASNLAALDTQYRTLSGLSNVVTARNNLDVFSKTESNVRYALKNGATNQVFSVADATQPAHAIPLSQLNTLLVSATETVKGIAEIASASEMVAGTDDERIVTPKKVSDNFLRRSNNLSDITNAAQARANLGITSLATQPESTFVRDDSLVGQVATFARTTAPTGWLLCNGQAVSRTTYSALFAAIGTTYGAGNGSTTFNLPDCRNEFFRGWDGNTGVVGNKFSDSYAAHNHTASSEGAGGHGHTAWTGEAGWHGHSASTTGAGAHTHSTRLGDAITSGETSTISAGGGLINLYANVDAVGDHVHGVSIAGNGNHTHTVGVSSVGDHAHTIVVNNSGSSETRPRGIYFLVCIRY
jgi:microcystin-dependent protein